MKLFSLVLLGTGCYSEWKPIDVDGDGISVLEGDCWESNIDPVPPEGALDHGVTAADIHTGAEDLPYDGIDANCDGKDDFDADGDGYVPAAYEGLITIGFGSDYQPLPAGDCFDSIVMEGIDLGVLTFDDPTGLLSPIDVHPAADDVWYDGADQNCDGLSDYDQDKDGIDSDRYSGLDCNDLDDSIYPSAIEIYYDGVDQNCDQASDFDADHDGQDSSAYGGLDCNDENPAIYASTESNPREEIYYNGLDDNCDDADVDGDQDGDGFWDINYPFTESEVDSSVIYPEAALLIDCWDDQENPPEGFNTIPVEGQASKTAAQVYPAAEEIFYDGIDQDCGGDDDFDQDGDGFRTADHPDLDGIYGEDCVDSEMEADFYSGFGITPADIYPENPIDAWYDGNDQNCDGENDFDQDGDGQNSSAHGGPDCDDLDEDVFHDPNLSSVIEIPNDGIDQNCDGFEDCYIDQDQDSFGSNAIGMSSALTCLATGFSNNANDCNDSNETIYPNAIEICDGLINACGGALPSDEIDDDGDHYVECAFAPAEWYGNIAVTGGGDCDDTDPNIIPDLVWYADLDGDAYGDPENWTVACEQPDGFIADNQDCNDSDDTVYFGAPELCDGQDNSCSNSLLPVESDLDGDFYVACAWDAGGWDGDPSILGDEDCDDDDPLIFPTATEGLNDGIDQNCDGLELCPVDLDGDLYGDSSAGTGLSPNCSMGGFSADDSDCDDTNNRAYPGVASSDSPTACLVDEDFDGYGDISPSNPNISAGSDCNDSDGSVHPTATEGVNDALDQNCDGLELCYLDEDLDGYGNLAGNTGLSNSIVCVQVGFSDSAVDCHDGDDTVYPNALELCDGQLNNCNGAGIPAIELDDDGDGYVDCTWDAGGWDGLYVEGGDDCDDDDERKYPVGIEQCDGIANICGSVLDITEIDTDGDFYVACESWTGAGSILGGGDCAPGDGLIHPNAAETINDGIDQNCDLQELCYIDNDQDTYGNSSGNTAPSSSLSCMTAGFANNTSDCDDVDPLIYPGAVEICDGQLNDCDGSGIPSDETDDDGDFYVECDIGTNIWTGSSAIISGGDCDDLNELAYPFAVETMGPSDLNCDGLETAVLAEGSNFENCASVTVDSGSYERYYLYCEHSYKWGEAKSICQAGGYHSLARIENAAENDEVHGLINNDSWFGFNDISNEGVYAWGDGSLVTGPYFNWVEGSAPTTNEVTNCFQVRAADGAWEDKQCWHNKNFVCSVVLP